MPFHVSIPNAHLTRRDSNVQKHLRIQMRLKRLKNSLELQCLDSRVYGSELTFLIKYSTIPLKVNKSELHLEMHIMFA